MKQDNQREDIAYLAGLIDGEGTIAIYPTKEKWGIKYQVLISFVNTNRTVVKMVAKFIGTETIFIHDPSKSGFQNRLLCYKCKIVGTVKPLEPLLKLLPYLIIKRRQAQLAIELCQNMKRSNPTRTALGKHRIPAEETQWRKNLYNTYKAIAHPQRLNRTTSKDEVIV